MRNLLVSGQRGTTITASATVLLLGLGFAGCSGDQQTEGAGSCASVMQFNGKNYKQMKDQGKLQVGSRLEDGHLPPCDDTNDKGDRGEAIAAWELKGVHPDEAIAARFGGELELWVAEDLQDPCAIAYASCK